MSARPANRVSFTDLASAVYDLERLLKSMGLTVPVDSPLEEAALAIEELRAVYERQAVHRHEEDHRSKWRRALSLGDLALRLLEVRDHSDFHRLAGHLQLLIGERDLTQYAVTPRENTDNDKIFELWASAPSLKIVELSLVVKQSGNTPSNWRLHRSAFNKNTGGSIFNAFFEAKIEKFSSYNG